jgi:hypothetical protein
MSLRIANLYGALQHLPLPSHQLKDRKCTENNFLQVKSNSKYTFFLPPRDSWVWLGSVEVDACCLRSAQNHNTLEHKETFIIASSGCSLVARRKRKETKSSSANLKGRLPLGPRSWKPLTSVFSPH